MSAETCGGKVVARWEGKKCTYFLRDDFDAGICEHERYSLFRETPDYCRLHVYSMTREQAISMAGVEITLDQQSQKQKHTCVACGAVYYGSNHHCDPVKEKRVEAGRKSYAGNHTPPTYYQRLKDGFRMLGGEPF